MKHTLGLWAISAACALVACCDDDGGSDAGTDASDANIDAVIDTGPSGPAESLFELDGPIDTSETFFDLPWPSDLRLNPDGTPDMTGYPAITGVELVDGLIAIVGERQAFPMIPVASFRFTAPLAAASSTDVIAAQPDSPVLLVDVDSDSPEHGALIPTVAYTQGSDSWTGENLLSVAPRPGFILRPETTYAAIIRTSFNDAAGEPLVVNAALATLAADGTPEGARGPDAAALYAPMWATLDTLGVARNTVAAATVFTTGDVVRETHELSNRVLDAATITLDALRLDPTDGTDHERYCELVAQVELPQYQRGTPPFNTEGTFEIGDDGLPIEQRRETALVHLAIPKQPMPTNGYPLLVYFHGSGGTANEPIDRSPITSTGMQVAGEGPAHVIAEHGYATLGTSLPLSPDRLPGASAIEYLNLSNLSAFRDTFRQGMIEQRLMVRMMREIEISPATLAGCLGPELPVGATAFRFDPDHFAGMGQSMGGMYTNLVGAIEPSLEALVPTGAGGHWSYFATETPLIPGLARLLATVLRVPQSNLTFLHPSLHLLALGWEAAEPLVSMPRLSRRPLEGFPARPIYEPVGADDEYFPIQIYDAVVLAYGHPQAGDEVWPSMQQALALDGLDGFTEYPVINNLTSENGETYTGIAVQYAPDFTTGHYIYMQLEDVRYQWSCFLRTVLDTGTGVVPAPAPLGTPCPTE